MLDRPSKKDVRHDGRHAPEPLDDGRRARSPRWSRAGRAGSRRGRGPGRRSLMCRPGTGQVGDRVRRRMGRPPPTAGSRAVRPAHLRTAPSATRPRRSPCTGPTRSVHPGIVARGVTVRMARCPRRIRRGRRSIASCAWSWGRQPHARLGLRHRLAPAAFALLETTGRRTRRVATPSSGTASTGTVLGGRSPRDAVRLRAEPRARAPRAVLVDGAWRTGAAVVMADDDPVARSRTLRYQWDAALGGRSRRPR